MRLFYFLFILFALSHVYFYICLRRAFGRGLWQIPVGLWLLAMVAAWVLRFGDLLDPSWQVLQDLGFFWMGFLILACYCLLGADVLSLLTRLAARFGRAGLLKKLAAGLRPARYVPVALGLAVGLYAYALWEAQNPVVRYVDLPTDKLPAGSPPIRIVGLADVHISSIIGPWMERRMVARVNELRPDIVLMAGDFVDADLSGRAAEAALWSGLEAPLGKFAVTGNHEYYQGLGMSLEFIGRSGFRVLRGEAESTGGIVIAGIDDAGPRSGPGARTDLAAALDKLDPEKFILVMNHKPYYPPATVGRFDLLFSGHTHAGQFWPGEHVVGRIYGHPQGLSVLREGQRESLLYITNGIGFWGPPIRFLAPPEITVFTVRPFGN